VILRRIGAVILGLIIAVAFVQIAELGVHAISPPPPGMSMQNMDAIKAYVAALPVSALLLVLAGWLAGTLLGTSTAARIGRNVVTGYIVGGVLFCMGAFNAIVFPQPIWYSVALSVIYIAGTVIAARLAAPRPALSQAPPPASI
jgi:hypothetical protein